MALFVADENVDSGIVIALRRSHEVLSIAENEQGASDERVMEICRLKNAILITSDKDFGEYLFRFRRASAGIVLCRLSDVDPKTRAETVLAAVSSHGEEMIGHYTVITSRHIRIRTIG